MNGELDPGDEARLAELVAVLRGAGPGPAELAEIRARVVGPARGWGRIGWGVCVVFLASLAGASLVGGRLVDGAREGSTRASGHGRAPVSIAAPAATPPAAAPTSPTPVAPAATPIAVPPSAATAPAGVSPVASSAAAWPGARGLRRRPQARAAVRARETRASAAPVSSKLGGPTPAPPEPSAVLASALRAHAAARCAEAIVDLQRVVEGETVDSPADAGRAELLLAECLHRLGYPHASLAVLASIAGAGEDHPGFLPALPTLALLTPRLPDLRELTAVIGRYPEEALATLAPEARATLGYAMGRARYDEGELDAAARLFSGVPAGAPWYVPARYYEGVTHVRRHRARPAADAFAAVVDDVGTPADGGIGERARYRDLAWLALGRLYYSVAGPGRDGGDLDARSELLARAVTAWQRVPFGSEHGLDAFFEESWALYVLGEHARALGHIHGLLSPFFEDRLFPEALVLRATVEYEHCRYEAAEQAVRDFHDRYDGLLDAVEGQERAIGDAPAGFALLSEVRAGRGPTGLLGRVLQSAFEDRELARQLVHVGSIDAEAARLSAAGAPLRGSSLAARIAQEHAVARALAIERAGEAVRARLRWIADGLRDRANDADTATRRREALASGLPLTTAPERPVPIVAVQGDQEWPFDGEYWEDEVEHYREAITSLCPAR